MNRLILIGNGFDLAHGMKTSYRDFIFDYLRRACEEAINNNTYSDNLIKINNQELLNPIRLNECKNFFDLVEMFINGDGFSTAFGSNTLPPENYSNKRPGLVISKPHKFIATLFQKCQTMNWVDIEDEYYNYLKHYLTLQDQNRQSAIINLNKVMGILSSHITKYMSKQNAVTPIREYEQILRGKILVTDLASNYINANEDPKTNLILNFNYTDTIYKYTDDARIRVNFIHGKINDSSNPIVFGFGDELDSDYKKIEEAKEKGFLDYMKSFGYSKNSNYHNLIRFISSDDYQVYILGHSCGLSDRTMLNMIFEHDNCKSIKIFYHGTRDKNNHTELTQEISRHFHNKGKMRERIVPLDKSSRMPQFDD